MLRGIWGDPERFMETHWSRFAEQGWYFAGDGARYDADETGVLGRIDDVMNVSGHRISTAEVEPHSSDTRASPKPPSSAPPTTTGQAICAFVILTASSARETDDEAGRRATRR
jgi:acetyl-CoA synthetase